VYDADADLYYYKARWYDSTIGRFVSEDPMGFTAGDANVSRYVGNGVTTKTDATGLAVWVWPWDPNASWNPMVTVGTWGEMVVDGVYTGDISASSEISQAAMQAAAENLGRPGMTFSGSFGGGTFISGGVQFGGHIVWNWGTLSFDEYYSGGPFGSAGFGPGVTAGGSIGLNMVYGVPWNEPEAYEGWFNEYTATVNPEGIGGYGTIALTPGDYWYAPGDGPWSVGAGVNLGTPGANIMWSPQYYDYIGQSGQ